MPSCHCFAPLAMTGFGSFILWNTLNISEGERELLSDRNRALAAQSMEQEAEAAKQRSEIIRQVLGSSQRYIF